MRRKHAPCPSGDHGVGRVRHRRADEGGQAHDRDLQRVVAGRIDELREKGAEEDQRLRIADGNEQTLQEKSAARDNRRLASLVRPLERIICQPIQIR